MSWYAVDAIDDSLDATKAFLFPFSLGRWARLALITLFLSASGGGAQNIIQFVNSAGQYAESGTKSVSGGGSYALAPLFSGGLADPAVLAQMGQPIRDGLPFALGLVGFVLIAVTLALVLLLILATPVFTFVLVDAIATDEVRIRKPFTRHFWKGVRLLIFQFVVILVFIGSILAIATLYMFGRAAPDVGVSGILGALLLFGLWLLLFALVSGFTKQFVVPVMYVDDAGIISAWSDVWSIIAGEPKQTVVYLLMHLLVGIGVSIVRGLLTLLGVFFMGMIALLLGFATSTAVGGAFSADMGIGVGVLVGLAVGLPLYFVFVFLPLNVLTQTYLRSYELASLAGFAPEYDTLRRYRDDGSDGVAGATDEDVPPGGPGGSKRDSDIDGSGADGGDDGFGEFVPAEDPGRRDEFGGDATKDAHGSGTGAGA